MRPIRPYVRLGCPAWSIDIFCYAVLNGVSAPNCRIARCRGPVSPLCKMPLMTLPRSRSVGALLLGLIFQCCSARAAPPDAAANFARYTKDVQPLLAQYCFQCHGDKKQEGELTLAAFKDAASIGRAHKTWEKVFDRVAEGEMPPMGKPKPSEQETKLLKDWLGAQLDSGIKDPGRVTIRRLNRNEYNNTIRDLVGIDFKPADDFPSDDVGEGFDNIGDVLSLPPLLMEKYLAAAEKIMAVAILTEPTKAQVNKISGRKLKGDAMGERIGERAKSLSSNGELYGEFDFTLPGDYNLRIKAYGDQAGGEPAKMTVKLDGKELKTFDVKAVAAKPHEYSYRVTSSAAGKRKVAVAFINDYYQPDDPNPNNRDRNLIVVGVEVEGPLDVDVRTLLPAYKKIFTVVPKPDGSDKEESARTIIRTFASHAFRRYARPEEVERLMKFYRASQQEGESFEQSLQYALQAVLVSPNFLFRIEADPTGNQPKRIEEFELATRLSYFLWSSMPDDELFKLAATNQLRHGDNLRLQVARMLKDRRSLALVDNFAGQWLQIRNLNTVTPAKTTFPNFDDQIKADMRTETEMFFEHVMRDNCSVLDFIDGNYTFVNDRLAKHYGMPGVSGKEFRKVSFTDNHRSGILTQGSILTITSNPTRTSPVKRGKWILDNILGAPPPPPPPNVPDLNEGQAGEKVGSLRTRLELHRANAICASCHAKMDPLGFGFENFDAIGQWRTKDGKYDVDSSGVLPSGQKFKGPAELRAILKENRDGFCRCLAQKMSTYALGRGLTRSDRGYIDEIASSLQTNEYRFSSLVMAIVRSEPFQMRGVKKEAK